MYRDISEIRQFYQSLLGRMTSHVLHRKIQKIWNEPLGSAQNTAGIGYTIPYLQSDDKARSFSVMTATQGVVRWPSQGSCRTVLTEDHILPFANDSIDRLLMVHAVENSDYMRELMQECWRVLAPQGRLLLVVPNRAGIWSHADKTPFGYGRPYSMKQLRSVLRDLQFVIERHEYALYFFPSHNRILLTMATLLEKIGAVILPKCGGVTLVEVSKQLYNVTPLRVAPVKGSTAQSVWRSDPVPTG